jgi:antitoxin Phd
MQEVQLRDAKAQFSAVVDAAEKGEPTVVTRHGTPVAVVVGHAEWQRLTGARPSFAELLLAFPEDEDNGIRRDPTPVRGLGS